MHKKQRVKTLLFLCLLESLDDLCHEWVSDDVFIPEEDCLDSLYVLCQLYSLEQAGILPVG